MRIPLLDYLATSGPAPAARLRDWEIIPIAGGANNLLYRARGPQGDLAVKITIGDGRDRAGREYHALLALGQAGLDLGPAPVWLDRDGYPQPVVVQTWLAGPVAAAPPADDVEWLALLEHLAGAYGVGPEDVALELPPAVLAMTSAKAGKQRIAEQLACIPTAAQPAAMRDVLDRLVAGAFPTWPDPPRSLCRCDPNTLNFVRRPGRWASVDWENSGWGDAAFEIADLLAHPAYRTVSTARREWIIATYSALRAEPGAAERIRVYYLLTVGWWVARLTRALYEVPRGQDDRLVVRPAGWLTEAHANYEHYLRLAAALLE